MSKFSVVFFILCAVSATSVFAQSKNAEQLKQIKLETKLVQIQIKELKAEKQLSAAEKRLAALRATLVSLQQNKE